MDGQERPDHTYQLAEETVSMLTEPTCAALCQSSSLGDSIASEVLQVSIPAPTADRRTMTLPEAENGHSSAIEDPLRFVGFLAQHITDRDQQSCTDPAQGLCAC